MRTILPKTCRSKPRFSDAGLNLTSHRHRIIHSKFFVFRPKFRSYKPQHESLKDNIIEDAKPGDVEAVVQEQLDAANSKVVIEELVSWRWAISNRIYFLSLFSYQ